VITGGLSGLGRELAQLYIAADARVAILDIKDEDEDGACTSSARYYKCDVSNSDDVEATVNRIQSEVSRIKMRMNQMKDYFPALTFISLDLRKP
jgi:NAD(P)-dependent dehydrogenase (short-subunit alcohol dehydrogenase family)